MSQRKINQGKIDIDFEESSLIVHYDIVPVQKNENGRVVEISDLAKAESKRIKIKSLAPDKNLAQMAADIVDKCKYLHPSRIEEVEQLLIKMRKFFQSNASNVQAQSKAEEVPINYDGGGTANYKERRNRDEPKTAAKGPRSGQFEDEEERGPGPYEESGGDEEEDRLPAASIDRLDDYLDMLYQVSGKSDKEKEEGLRVQIQGTGMILKLCRDVMNLEQLIQNNTVMGALARVLQEEYKKSVELTFNILRIFLAFSNFMEMHPLMANYRIGMLTMKAIDYEVKRFELRAEEEKARDTALEAEIADIKAESRQSASAAIKLQESMHKLRCDRARESAKMKRQRKNQDKLLFVAFYVLLNLADDPGVERKMIKKSLIETLVMMLDHSLVDLLILATSFLKKLSLYEDNKDAMKSLNLVSKVSKFLPSSSQPLMNMSLRLLFNLSFDPEARGQMLKEGLVPKVIQLLKTPALRARTLKLLYHLSAEDRCKSIIPYTAEGVPIIVGMIVNFPQSRLAKELAALAVNISLNARTAELMAANKGINYLMDRLASTRDLLLLKVLRNISQWTFNAQNEGRDKDKSRDRDKDKESGHSSAYRSLWAPHVKLLVEVVCDSDSPDLSLEAIGCLANLTTNDLPSSSSWAKLLKETSLLSVLCTLITSTTAQDDLVLEIVLLLSSVADDAQACVILAGSSVIGSLYQIWHDKNADDGDVEIQLQIAHCFNKLFQHEASREEAMYSTRVVSEIIISLSHRHAAIRLEADALAEIVLELDRGQNGDFGALGSQILRKRFEGHNLIWMQSTGLSLSSPLPPSYSLDGYTRDTMLGEEKY